MNRLPLFALNTVLFPGGRLDVRVFEKRYVDMVTHCLKADAPFGVCLIKSGAEVGSAAEPHSVGTLAHVVECDMKQAGILQVRARGGGRFRVRATEVRPDQLLLAETDDLPSIDMPLPERHRRLRETLRQILAKAGPESYFQPERWDSAAWIADRMAELLPLPAGLKQALLEMDEAAARLDVLAEFFPGAGDAPGL